MLLRQQVGRFEMRDFLGRGAIGDVMLAWDPERQGEVALKVVRTRQADPEMLEAEKNGVSLQQQLSRAAPQVAAVYEWGQDEGFFWVCMEYVPGDDLSAVLSRGALPEPRAVEIALQLCEMLEVCHEFSAEIGGRKVFGVVHGDIKPENIRLQDGDRVRVLDFGIAKHLSQTRRFTVNLFGSLPYTPPERLERGIVDRHSDLWALGIVLYIMVSGHRPFAGATAEELDRQIRRGTPPLPLPPSVSPRLAWIIEKSLAFDVGERYATASALRADLEAFRDGRPLAAGSPRDAAPSDLTATRRTDRGIRPEDGEPRESQEPREPRETLEDAEATRLDATRRTDRPAFGSGGSSAGLDSTRRTFEAGPSTATSALPPPLPVPAAPGAAPVAGPPPFPIPPGALPPPLGAAGQPMQPSQPKPSRLGRRILFALVLVLIGLGAMGHAWVRGEAREIRRALAAQARPDLNTLVARYEGASRIGLLGGSELTAAGGELREALLAAADRILDSYHGDEPVTTERGWQQAQQYFQAALGIERDAATRARLLYAQAHLDRIEAQSLRQKGQTRAATEKTDEAIHGFREAARRDKEWPDPYLGLARIYAYQRFDLKELEESLGQLGRRGYRVGRREKAMLADGYRMQAKLLWDQAVQVHGEEGEGRLLERCRDSLRQAIGFYDDIPRYANSENNREGAQRLLDQVNARLEELDSGFSINIPFFHSDSDSDSE
ncbi:MAG TPA: serine/threonine-protein kinase [Thermoanaerobaculia bacterium]|nr:serine/threonine-protein kinase [Thermoanaerobaculia bacterium]